MKNPIINLLLLFLLILGISCNNDLVELQEVSKPINENHIENYIPPRVKNGILVFDDEKHLYKTISWLQELSDEEFLQIEKSTLNGFVSQRTIFKNILDEETKMVNLYLKSDKLSKAPKRSEIYREKLKSEFIIENMDENGNISFSLKLNNPIYLSVANEDGNLIIANETINLYSTDNEIDEQSFDLRNIEIPIIKPGIRPKGTCAYVESGAWITKGKYRAKNEYSIFFFEDSRYNWRGTLNIYENAEVLIGNSWYRTNNMSFKFETKYKSYWVYSLRGLYRPEYSYDYIINNTTRNYYNLRGSSGNFAFNQLYIFNPLTQSGGRYTVNLTNPNSNFYVGLYLEYIKYDFKIDNEQISFSVDIDRHYSTQTSYF